MPSLGPSLLPTATVLSKCCVVEGHSHPSLGLCDNVVMEFLGYDQYAEEQWEIQGAV